MAVTLKITMRSQLVEVNKLVPNLGNKSKYVVHYKNLQLYLSLGMKLTKVHRILKLKQSDWMTKYIDFNTGKRKNAVFGKTMQNLRSVKLVNNANDYVKHISKSSFVSQEIFSKNFVAIYEIKPVLKLNKQIYIGFNILDLSKLLMYEFYYKYIKSKFDVDLLFTDTDNLVYEIETEDVYKDFYEDKNFFDFSDYPLNSKFFDPTNKNVIDKMKDEFKGSIISEFGGLKSKMYSLIAVDAEEVKKAKGLNKIVVKKVTYEKSADVLFNKKKMIRHCTELEFMMFVRFHCLFLMIKDIY